MEDALEGCLTPVVWAAIIERAIAGAKEGDKDARKWLSDYSVGQPVQRQEVDLDTRVVTRVAEEIVSVVALDEPQEERGLRNPNSI